MSNKDRSLFFCPRPPHDGRFCAEYERRYSDQRPAPDLSQSNGLNQEVQPSGPPNWALIFCLVFLVSAVGLIVWMVFHNHRC